jgi:hypothetical protein
VGSAPDGKDYTQSHRSLEEGEGARECKIIIARLGLGFLSMHPRAPRCSLCKPTSQPGIKRFLEPISSKECFCRTLDAALPPARRKDSVSSGTQL